MKEAKINIFTQGIKFTIEKEKEFKDWIIEVIVNEGKNTGEINFIYCSDKYLLEINKKFLQHDFYTDIVTFDNSEKANEISGDIFISYERVVENAVKLSELLEYEISRVTIHGILHLIGYNDSNSKEIEEMRNKEDQYIFQKKFKFNN
ncbi:MAG: rRNA maturation RNase YbeY [Bacteroidales bacterium]|nr:rRNA maturation RNase YbeY [Bacteroidales bacterium]